MANIQHIVSLVLLVIYCTYLRHCLAQWFKDNRPLYPCPDMAAVRWIRHPRFCAKYFICYFGQPISMPDCPIGQVWSNSGKNCVPRTSRFDDCYDVKPITPRPWKITSSKTRSPFTKMKPSTPGQTIQTHTPKTNEEINLLPSYTTKTNKDTRSSSSLPIYKSTILVQTKPQPPPSLSSSTFVPIKTITSWLTANVTRKVSHMTSQSPSASFAPVLLSNPCETILPSLTNIHPHPRFCHWYYNCSLGSGLDTWDYYERYSVECRYPQLFDALSLTCNSFLTVDCDQLFEPKDPCEYREQQCTKQNCIPCNSRFGSCRDKPNGIYVFESKEWTPTYVTCYDERNIAQDDCEEPTPIFSPEIKDCVSMYDVPKDQNGLRPDCSYRRDGDYPDEYGRCAVYFECTKHLFGRYVECPLGEVYNPTARNCTSAEVSPPPCGTGVKPTCINRPNGVYADPYGRCPYYFECRYGEFMGYQSCDYGSFDAISGKCLIPLELMVKPCGMRHNQCQNKISGRYLDENEKCKGYVECENGILLRNSSCSSGFVFNEDEGRCEGVETAPVPCGTGPSCRSRQDGQYPAPRRGCSYYYRCTSGRFMGFRRCTYLEGGYFFNKDTGRCDFPHNICPPCGYRWYGCRRQRVFK